MGDVLSLVRCPDYQYSHVLQGIKDVLEPLGQMKAFVRKGDKVLLKPNLLYGKHPDKAVTTHPSIVKAVAQLVLEEGATPMIGDSPGVGTLRRVATQTGIAEVARYWGCTLVDFDDVATLTTRADNTFRRFELAKDVLQADVVINLPKIKTHGMMLLTLAVKNIFGCIPGLRKAQWHLKAGIDHLYFAAMLVELCQLVRPSLTIIDGVIAMEGNGPGSGDPRHLGLILAGNNPFTIDSAICQVLGIAPDVLPTIQAARQRGLDGTDPNKLTIVGQLIEHVKVTDFKLPRRFDLQWRLPHFITKPLKRIVTPKPVVHERLCKHCGTCEAACPTRAVCLDGERVTIDYDRCIRCYCCQEMCPEGAVCFKHGWLARTIS